MFRALCRSSSGTSTVLEPLVYKHLWRPPVVPPEWELSVWPFCTTWNTESPAKRPAFMAEMRNMFLYPENGARMIVRNTDHHHTARCTKTKTTERNTLWGLITPTVSRAVLLRLVEWWTGKPLERRGRHLIVTLEDLGKTTKSSVRTACVLAKLRTDKPTIGAFALLRCYAEQVGSWFR
jgi:hypothetical protein